MKILLVEDDPKIVSFLKKGFEEEFFCIDVCDNGEDAIYLASVNTYDVMVLDIMLRGLDGYAVCQAIRSHKIKTPIIMLSAKSTIEDKVTFLNLGADDYVTKPFSFEELLARIRVQFRKKEQVDDMLCIADLELNLTTKRVSRAKILIDLTSKEYAILEHLMRFKDSIVSEETLLDTIFSFEKTVNSNIVNVYMYRLRTKIDKNFEHKLIKTYRNQGFIISDSKNNQ